MSVSHLYTNFDTPPTERRTSGSEVTRDAVEDLKLAAFEEGYQAGWDDAVNAHADSGVKLSEEFVQTLQDMSFTYQEAYKKVTLGMQPVMSAVVAKLLPRVAEQSLVPQILEQMAILFDAERDSMLEIAVAPDNRETIEALLSDQTGIPFSISEETSLGLGQIYLRAGTTEREINVDKVIEGVSSAIDAFFHTAEQEIKHG